MPALRPMRARDVDEAHRGSTPLEALFDLTFVVAISLLVAQFAETIVEDGNLLHLLSFFAVFYLIWWAWTQSAWLASAYDTDDVLYRIATMVQMAGVLVLAAGVPAAFNDRDWLPVTIGYVISRIGLLTAIVRAIRDDTETGPIARRYVLGIGVVMALWLLRLLLPHELLTAGFVLLVVIEMAIPAWADRAAPAGIRFHAHHIAERHGLFSLILLGECVLASATAVRDALTLAQVSGELVTSGVSSLVILFSLWWIYFSEPTGERLERSRHRSFFWAYGHYIVFVALGLVGSGLDIAVDTVVEPVEATPILGAGMLAWPVAVFLLANWTIHVILHTPLAAPHWVTWSASILIALSPLSAPFASVIGAEVIVAVILVAVVVAIVVPDGRPRLPSWRFFVRSSDPGPSTAGDASPQR